MLGGDGMRLSEGLPKMFAHLRSRTHRTMPATRPDQRIGLAAIASYTVRQARRRVNRRGFGPSALESARQTAVAR